HRPTQLPAEEVFQASLALLLLQPPRSAPQTHPATRPVFRRTSSQPQRFERNSSRARSIRPPTSTSLCAPRPTPCLPITGGQLCRTFCIHPERPASSRRRSRVETPYGKRAAA